MFSQTRKTVYALRQQPIENVHLLDPEVGEFAIVDRRASRQPAIPDVASDEPFEFVAPNPPSTVA